MLFPRECPERYPIYLSEDISKTLGDYKLIFQGLTLLMESAKIEVDQSELLSLMRDMPMFPDVGLFNLRFDSLDLFKTVYANLYCLPHVGEFNYKCLKTYSGYL